MSLVLYSVGAFNMALKRGAQIFIGSEQQITREDTLGYRDSFKKITQKNHVC